MNTSDRAIEKLKDEMLNRLSSAGLGFRVCQDSDGSGKTGLALKIDKKSPDDEIIEVHGIRLFLDPLNSAKLKDLELDYDDSPAGGFIMVRSGHPHPVSA